MFLQLDIEIGETLFPQFGKEHMDMDDSDFLKDVAEIIKDARNKTRTAVNLRDWFKRPKLKKVA